MKPTHKLKLTSALFATAIGLALFPVSSANASIGQCPSGYMCLWSGANYTGAFQQISATGSYRAITLSTVESYYNHRSYRTWLHEKVDGSGNYICLAAGAKKASGLSGWQDNPKAVWLTTIANC